MTYSNPVDTQTGESRLDGDENFDFFQLRRELSRLEAQRCTIPPGKEECKPVVRDRNLPIEAVDWTPWIAPDITDIIGRGGFGLVYMGKWSSHLEPIGKLPRVVVKVMTVERLPSEADRKRYKVRSFTSLLNRRSLR